MTSKPFRNFETICFPSGLLTIQLKVILVMLEQQQRMLPNVKHPTATSTSYRPYISYSSSYTGRKISSIIKKYCKDLNVIQ